jgi:hypothetical protein
MDTVGRWASSLDSIEVELGAARDLRGLAPATRRRLSDGLRGARRSARAPSRSGAVGPDLAANAVNGRVGREALDYGSCDGSALERPTRSARAPGPPVRSPLCAAIPRIAAEEVRRWRPGGGPPFTETSLAASAILREYYQGRHRRECDEGSKR